MATFSGCFKTDECRPPLPPPASSALPQERGDRFVARTGFDPRAPATPYRWFPISPRRIRAWREVNELPDRELMRDGRWSV
jgi:hypothetical protein